MLQTPQALRIILKWGWVGLQFHRQCLGFREYWKTIRICQWYGWQKGIWNCKEQNAGDEFELSNRSKQVTGR